MGTPGSRQLMRGNGDGAYNGWPNLPELETLHDEWLVKEDEADGRALARRLQEQALQDMPYLPLGSYDQPAADRSDLAGVPKGLVQFTGMRRA